MLIYVQIFYALYLFSDLHLVPNQRLENLFLIFLPRKINQQQQKYDTSSGVLAILWRETNENDRKEIGVFCHMKFRFVQKNNFEIQWSTRAFDRYFTDSIAFATVTAFLRSIQFDKQELLRVYAITLYMGTVCN